MNISARPICSPLWSQDDYAETDQPQLARMWDKRQRSYRAMGYEIKPMESGILGSGQILK